jgi:hypothetical protein
LRVVIVTDRIPINKKRAAVEKTIKHTLSEILPKEVSYAIYHHDSKSHYMLQVADYCNWAILRKWNNGESYYYNKIRSSIRSEYDIFKTGNQYFY